MVRDGAAERRLMRRKQEWTRDFIVDELATGSMVRILKWSMRTRASALRDSRAWARVA